MKTHKYEVDDMIILENGKTLRGWAYDYYKSVGELLDVPIKEILQTVYLKK